MNFALYRFPSSSDTILVKNSNINPVESRLEELSPGFIIQPFHPDAQRYVISGKAIKNPSKSDLSDCIPNLETITAKDTPHEKYLQLVTDAVELISSDEIKKLVPAKTKTIKSESSNPFGLFEKLCERYPQAFISLHSTDLFGTWIGATPEVLLEISKDNILHTVALAGTQLSEGRTPKEAAWSQKEIEEQALVSRYIINYLKHIRLREFEEVGPKTIQAGNLFHLKTDYYINLKDVAHTNLVTTLVDLLHPTSAVCGLPKEASLKWLLENEDFDRSLYSGFIGPVQQDDETHLYVNLRCAKLGSNMHQLFAGAGVTADSIPEKEWIETENKCRIIGNLL